MWNMNLKITWFIYKDIWYQGRIQDLKLGVAQMENFKKSGGQGWGLGVLTYFKYDFYHYYSYSIYISNAIDISS